MASVLAAVVAGRPLSADDARVLWERFSAYMERHEGDFAGFAAAEGFASASVAMRDGRPTLTLGDGTAAKPKHAGDAVDGRARDPGSGATKPAHRAEKRRGGKRRGGKRRGGKRPV